jgi:hypothetical protein
MTETTGWPPPEPDDTDTAGPVAAAEPDSPPEPAAGDEPQPEPVPPEAASEPPAPDPVPPPFIPVEGVAEWLRELLMDFHQRLRNAGF